MIPTYRILADDKDVTASIKGQAFHLRVTDKEGVEADEVELTVTDPAGRVALPRRGVVLRPAMGWLGKQLIEKGSFTVDEVEHSGPPDQVRIRGRGTPMVSALTQARDTSYHDQTVGDILRAIAGRHGLTPAIDEKIAAIKIPHLDQTRESDLHFITRLALDLDCIGTVKDGRLVFVPAGTGTGANGQKLPAARITRTAKIRHAFQIKDRDAGAGSAKAQFRDLGAAETMEVEVQGEGPATPDAQTLTLKRVYPTEEEARIAATMALKRANRRQAEISLELALGRPELVAGQPLSLEGWRPEIDGTDWVIEEVVHSLTEQSLTTSIKANSSAG